MVNKAELKDALDDCSKQLREFIKIEIDKLEAKFAEQAETIAHLNNDVSSLKTEVTQLQKKVNSLEKGLDEADAYERRDTVILSGDNVPGGQSGENCVEIVKKLALDKLNVTFGSADVSTAHRLGRAPENGPDKRKIIVKFCRRDISKRLCSAARSKRPAGLFINESLTPIRRKIFFTLRRIKQAHPNLVSGCSSVEGKIYVYTKPAPNSPPSTPNLKSLISTHDHLVSFCRDFIKVPLDTFLGSQ